MKPKQEASTSKVKSTYFKVMEKIVNVYSQQNFSVPPINGRIWAVQAVLSEIERAKETLSNIRAKFILNEFNEGVLYQKAQRLFEAEEAIKREYSTEDIRVLVKEINAKISELNQILKEKSGQILEKHLSYEGDV